MFRAIGIQIFILGIIRYCEPSIIIPASATNITKRETNSNFYPDWVPFKNKNIEELGELVDVKPKSKPKKRLASPEKFILTAVAEPQDDYYEKGGGGYSDNDNEDNFENKDWSDANRPVISNTSQPVLNHAELSEIDGIVNILTSKKEDPVSKAIIESTQKKIKKKPKQVNDYDSDNYEEIVNPRNNTVNKKEQSDSKSLNEDVDYEIDSSKNDKVSSSNDKDKETVNEATPEEKAEAEAKKAFILGTVDQLKERHAKEQRLISERAKEEEMSREVHEEEYHNLNPKDIDDKYSYINPRSRIKLQKIKIDYDDYEDQEANLEDKYRIPPRNTKTTTAKNIVADKNKNKESAKISVFRNPRFYMIDYDDGTNTPTKYKDKLSEQTTAKFSSKVSLRTPTTKINNSDETETISFVPEDGLGSLEEPTLFFPKKRKSKRKKIRTTSQAPYSTRFIDNISDLTSRTEVTTEIFSPVTITSRFSTPTTTTIHKTLPHITSPSAVDATAYDEVLKESYSNLKNKEETSSNSGKSEATTSALKNTAPSILQDTVPSAFQDTAPSAFQDTAPSTLQDTAPSSLQDTAPSALHDTAPSAWQDTTPSALKNTAPSALHDTSPSAWQDTSPSASNDTSPSALQDTAPSALQDTASSTLDNVPSAVETAPSAIDATPDSAEPLQDTLTSPSHHKNEKKVEDKDYHTEKGGGKEHHSEYEEDHGEKGKKAYEGLHKETKNAKGHHDKENHSGKYDDHGGHDKHHYDEKDHYGSHHHEESGKKHAKYEESGKHSKGHSTKGSHDVHKKDEYEKRVEFFEEDGDSAEEEKHGGYHKENRHSEGGQFSKGDRTGGHSAHDGGHKGFHSNGGHIHMHKGHKQSAGHDSHGKLFKDHHNNEGKQMGKKWIYHHGHPAVSANLIRVDRSTNPFMKGPVYFVIP